MLCPIFVLHIISVDDASGVSRQMANWLKNASTVSAPNPFQRQIFKGSKAKGVRSPLQLISYNMNKSLNIIN